MARVFRGIAIEDVVMLILIAGMYGLIIFASIGPFVIIADGVILVASLLGYGAHRPMRQREIGPAHFYAISAIAAIGLIVVYFVAVAQAILS